MGNQERSTPATAIINSLELLILMAGLIDIEAETARLQKEIDKLNKELDKAQLKLSNKSFIENAPYDVVLQERNRLLKFNTAIGKLKARSKDINEIQ